MGAILIFDHRDVTSNFTVNLRLQIFYLTLQLNKILDWDTTRVTNDVGIGHTTFTRFPLWKLKYCIIRMNIRYSVNSQILVLQIQSSLKVFTTIKDRSRHKARL